jgi:hypothetical protein
MTGKPSAPCGVKTFDDIVRDYFRSGARGVFGQPDCLCG